MSSLTTPWEDVTIANASGVGLNDSAAPGGTGMAAAAVVGVEKIDPQVTVNVTVAMAAVDAAVVTSGGGDRHALLYIVVVLAFYAIGIVAALTMYLKQERADIDEEKVYDDYAAIHRDPWKWARYYRMQQVMTRLHSLKLETEHQQGAEEAGGVHRTDEATRLDDDVDELTIDIPSLLSDGGATKRMSLPDGETVVVTFRMPSADGVAVGANGGNGGNGSAGGGGGLRVNRPSSRVRNRYETIDEERESITDSDKSSHLGENGTTADSELSDDSLRERQRLRVGSGRFSRRKRSVEQPLLTSRYDKGERNEFNILDEEDGREVNDASSEPGMEPQDNGAMLRSWGIKPRMSRWSDCLDLSELTSSPADTHSDSNLLSIGSPCIDNPPESRVERVNPCPAVITSHSTPVTIKCTVDDDFNTSQQYGLDSYNIPPGMTIDSFDSDPTSLESTHKKQNFNACDLKWKLENKTFLKLPMSCSGMFRSSKPTDIDAAYKEMATPFSHSRMIYELLEASYSRSLPFLNSRGKPTDIDSVSSQLLSLSTDEAEGGLVQGIRCSSSPSIPNCKASDVFLFARPDSSGTLSECGFQGTSTEGGGQMAPIVGVQYDTLCLKQYSPPLHSSTEGSLSSLDAKAIGSNPAQPTTMLGTASHMKHAPTGLILRPQEYIKNINKVSHDPSTPPSPPPPPPPPPPPCPTTKAVYLIGSKRVELLPATSGAGDSNNCSITRALGSRQSSCDDKAYLEESGPELNAAYLRSAAAIKTRCDDKVLGAASPTVKGTPNKEHHSHRANIMGQPPTDDTRPEQSSAYLNSKSQGKISITGANMGCTRAVTPQKEKPTTGQKGAMRDESSLPTKETGSMDGQLQRVTEKGQLANQSASRLSNTTNYGGNVPPPLSDVSITVNSASFDDGGTQSPSKPKSANGSFLRVSDKAESGFLDTNEDDLENSGEYTSCDEISLLADDHVYDSHERIHTDFEDELNGDGEALEEEEEEGDEVLSDEFASETFTELEKLANEGSNEHLVDETCFTPDASSDLPLDRPSSDRLHGLLEDELCDIQTYREQAESGRRCDVKQRPEDSSDTQLSNTGQTHKRAGEDVQKVKAIKPVSAIPSPVPATAYIQMSRRETTFLPDSHKCVSESTLGNTILSDVSGSAVAPTAKGKQEAVYGGLARTRQAISRVGAGGSGGGMVIDTAARKTSVGHDANATGLSRQVKLASVRGRPVGASSPAVKQTTPISTSSTTATTSSYTPSRTAQPSRLPVAEGKASGGATVKNAPTTTAKGVRATQDLTSAKSVSGTAAANGVVAGRRSGTTTLTDRQGSSSQSVARQQQSQQQKSGQQLKHIRLQDQQQKQQKQGVMQKSQSAAKAPVAPKSVLRPKAAPVSSLVGQRASSASATASKPYKGQPPQTAAAATTTAAASKGPHNVHGIPASPSDLTPRTSRKVTSRVTTI